MKNKINLPNFLQRLRENLDIESAETNLNLSSLARRMGYTHYIGLKKVLERYNIRLKKSRDSSYEVDMLENERE